MNHLGRSVLYVLPSTSANAGQVRAARITSDVNSLEQNLLVYFDKANDMPGDPDAALALQWVHHVDNVPFDPSGTMPNSWRWPVQQAGSGSEES